MERDFGWIGRVMRGIGILAAYTLISFMIFNGAAEGHEWEWETWIPILVGNALAGSS